MMAAANRSGSTNNWQRKNGFERERVPRPFVIGVAGGTASGKVKTIIHVEVEKFFLEIILSVNKQNIANE